MEIALCYRLPKCCVSALPHAQLNAPFYRPRPNPKLNLDISRSSKLYQSHLPSFSKKKKKKKSPNIALALYHGSRLLSAPALFCALSHATSPVHTAGRRERFFSA